MASRGEGLRRELRDNGVAHARVEGDSMLPTLRPGEVVRLAPISRPRRGDVLAFEGGGGLLVHRVVGRAPGGVVCRGDNRWTDDGVTPTAAVIGRAVSVASPDGGTTRRVVGGLPGAGCGLALATCRRLARAFGRAIAEADLLRRQLGGAPVSWRRADLGSRWHDCGASGAGDCTVHVLAASELDADAGLAATALASHELAIPADVYSMVPAAARSRLVGERLARAPAGARTTVFAFVLGPGARVARATAVLRHAIAVIGVRAGDPGDAAVQGQRWPEPTYVRFFSAEELTRELRAAGAGTVEVTPTAVGRMRLWRAEIRSSSGTR